LKRRSIQTYAELAISPLDECGFPAAVNDAFHGFRIRDKQGQERGGTTLIVVASGDPVAVWHYASQNRLILMLG
jgi:hypothetical protein